MLTAREKKDYHKKSNEMQIAVSEMKNEWLGRIVSAGEFRDRRPQFTTAASLARPVPYRCVRIPPPPPKPRRKRNDLPHYYWKRGPSFLLQPDPHWTRLRVEGERKWERGSEKERARFTWNSVWQCGYQIDCETIASRIQFLHGWYHKATSFFLSIIVVRLRQVIFLPYGIIHAFCLHKCLPNSHRSGGWAHGRFVTAGTHMFVHDAPSSTWTDAHLPCSSILKPTLDLKGLVRFLNFFSIL